jgi:hypothetical protein
MHDHSCHAEAKPIASAAERKRRTSMQMTTVAKVLQAVASAPAKKMRVETSFTSSQSSGARYRKLLSS